MKSSLYILLTAFVFLVGSCKKEPVGSSPQDEMVELSFTFRTPSSAQHPVKTYAITSADENSISQIILLAFKVSGSTETLDYCKQGMQIYAGGAPNEKSFRTTLKKSTDKYKFVLLINGGTGISSIVDGIAQGTEKEDVMEQLVMPVTQKWNTDPLAYTPLPMWGESAEVTGINSSTVIPDVALLRSVARVDITLSNAALANFTIESAHVYGMRDKLLMAPLPANLDVSFTPTAPSIATGTSALPLAQDYLYSAATGVIRDIYLPEANAGETYIVIGGKMNGDPTTYYYRADIENAGGTDIPILRNTRYVINITEVLNTGAATPAVLSTGNTQYLSRKGYLLTTTTRFWDEGN